MGGYKSYQEYKSTNLAWIPEIPAGWHVRKLTHAISYQVGFTPESGNAEYYGDDYLWANISDLGPKVLANTSKGITEEAIVKYKKRPAKKGSLLYSFKLSVGQVSFAGQDMFTNEAIASFGGSEYVDLSYFYFLAPIAIIQNASENIYGAKILNQEAIGAAKILVPPMEEQRKIAEFLDYKTAQIDTLIAKNQALLEKLAEQRTALISQAVTKGLDLSVPMKDSGVEWLGEIPAHWEMSKLRFVINDIEQGWSPQCHNQPANEDQWGVLKVGCVNGETFNHYENKALPEDLKPRERYEIQSGDILVSRANTKELLGSAALVKTTRSKLLLCDKLYRIKPSDKVDPDYLLRFLRSSIARYQYEKDATGTSGSMQNIGQDTIKNLSFPLPPYLEQVSIAQALEHEHAKILMLEDKISTVIQRLQEYRAALITNAVTGKIDVQNYMSSVNATHLEALR